MGIVQEIRGADYTTLHTRKDGGGIYSSQMKVPMRPVTPYSTSATGELP